MDDLEAITAAITRHGGRVLLAQAPVPTVGVLTKFEDPEGNVVSAMRYERHGAGR